MRPILTLLALTVLALPGCGSPPAAESTNNLRAELSPPSGGRLEVQNLVGSMTVLPGDGDKVIVTAVIHAESDDLASLVRFEEIEEEGGRRVLRLRYPLEEHASFRYARQKKDSDSHWAGLFQGQSRTTTTYDGHPVKVSTQAGVLLYADVEIRMPSGGAPVGLSNVVGEVSAKGVQGDLSFKAASGRITLADLQGKISAETGSGDVEAENLQGELSCKTGSGDVDVTGFEGESIECGTGSGDIDIREISASLFEASTGSGDVHVDECEVDEISARTGSGDIVIHTNGERIGSVEVGSGSGDIDLRLGHETGFEVRVPGEEKRITSHYTDIEPLMEDGELAGFRRGDGRIRISVKTSSGTLTVGP
jgi:hypothetical protein